MKTISERFVESRRERWQKLTTILLKIKRSSFASLHQEQIATFAQLYRLVSSDLALAKTKRLSPDVIEYLNNLVSQSHLYLYTFKPLSWLQLKKFFLFSLPKISLDKWRFLLLSAFFFLTPFLIMTILSLQNRGFAETVVPPSFLEQISESYRAGFSNQRGAAMSTLAQSFYIQNNASIAFFSFATGIFWGLGTIYFLIYNGLMLGAISGYIIASGYGDHFFSFVIAHSALELTGLIFAGAAGLLLGFTLLKATRFRRKDEVYRQRNSIFKLVMSSFLLLLFAAFVEGWISPQPLHLIIKIMVGFLSLLAIYFYFFALARKGRKDLVN